MDGSDASSENHSRNIDTYLVCTRSLGRGGSSSAGIGRGFRRHRPSTLVAFCSDDPLTHSWSARLREGRLSVNGFSTLAPTENLRSSQSQLLCQPPMAQCKNSTCPHSHPRLTNETRFSSCTIQNMSHHDTSESEEFHLESKWQEPHGDDSLTLYDTHRKPRKVNIDPSQRLRLPLKVRRIVE